MFLMLIRSKTNRNIKQESKWIYSTVVKNGTIDYVVCNYKEGTVSVFYEDGGSKKFLLNIDIYQWQYDHIPISDKYNLFFVQTWDKGLYAYNLLSGQCVWKIKGTRYMSVYVFDEYLITAHMDKSTVKIDVQTGEKLYELKGGTSRSLHYVDKNYIYIDGYRGGGVVINTVDMSIYKKYSSRVVQSDMDYTLRGVWLDNNILYAEGFDSIDSRSSSIAAERGIIQNSKGRTIIIDSEFYSSKNQ